MPRSRLKLFLTLALLAIAAAAVAVAVVLRHGFSARDKPSTIEAFVARRVRRIAIPSAARAAKNPIAATPEVLADARAHFADHCASCHANEGSGNAEIGEHLYPPAPDMRKAETQSLSDGEIFYIIHNGIRFTGMPAWGGDDPAEDPDSWKLVHFIRHLPELSSGELAEMKTLNPRSPHEMKEEEETEQFLRGEDQEPAPPSHRH